MLLPHIQRLGAGRLAPGIKRDLLHPRLGRAQQFLAAALERLAALVDRDRLLERHLAVLKPLDDGFELLDRALERQPRDVGVGFVGHGDSRVSALLADTLYMGASRGGQSSASTALPRGQNRARDAVKLAQTA